MTLWLPVLLVVLSNTFYHICTKSVPKSINPFASLSITYLVGSAASFLLYFITQKGGSLINEYRNLNWSSFVLGLAVVGIEAGFLYMYRMGWKISTGQIVSSALLAFVLIFVGFLLYREAITVKKVAGIVICMIGLFFINK